MTTKKTASRSPAKKPVARTPSVKAAAKSAAKSPVKQVAKAGKPAKAAKAAAPAKPAKAAASRLRPSGKPALKAATAARDTVKSAATRAVSGLDRSSAAAGELLRAGLKSLSLPKAELAMADGLSKIADSFGLKKLEDVFDHRVAAALERMGYPSAGELKALTEQIAALVRLLEPEAPSAGGRKKRK